MPHTFDVNAWNYGNETAQMEKLLLRAKHMVRQEDDCSSDAFCDIQDEEIRNWQQEHGKSFGLILCRALAKHMMRKHLFLISVPSYFAPVRDEDNKIWIRFDDRRHLLSRLSELAGLWQPRRYNKQCIIRSSALDEDWIDPRSGVHKSEMTYEHLLTSDLEALPDLNQVVVQQTVWGCGCVIDIGYSQLLDRVIARVAKGNLNLQAGGYSGYTSATWDANAQTSVYDAYTGEKLFGPAMEFHPGISGHENPYDVKFEPTPDLFPELIRGLTDSLVFMNIDFGVQLEVVVNPITLSHHLIQIRPSPIGVRGETQHAPANGQLLCTTAKVNKAGCVSGEIVSINAENTPENLTDALVHAYDAHQYKEDPGERIFEGKIVLWGRYYIYKHRYCPTESIRGATLLGAIAHMSTTSLFFNCNHGTTSEMTSDLITDIEQINNQCLLLSGFERDMPVNRRMIAGKTFCLVSDGLIGQIYLLP
jgi:hypothetical protein